MKLIAIIAFVLILPAVTFAGGGDCHCLRGDSVFYFINEEADTLEVEYDFLLFDNLKFEADEALTAKVWGLNDPFEDEDYCFSEKVMLKGGYYLIQLISNYGFTNQYVIGNSKTEKIKLYFIAPTNGFDRMIAVNKFIEVLEKKCAAGQMEDLARRVSAVAKRNQMRFPIFAE